jgi:hypothetical protein
MKIKQQARILSATFDEMIASPFGGEPITPEDAYTRVDVPAHIKRRAAAEWEAMDAQGNLPEGWKYEEQEALF